MRRPLPSAALPLALLAAAALACNEDFTPQYRVTDLRILSIRSEVPPGARIADPVPEDATLRLRALVANPRGRDPVRYRWIVCPPVAGEAVPPCLDPAFLRDPDRLAGAPGAVLVADGEGLEAVDVSLPDARDALAAMRALAEAEPAFACRPYVELPAVLVVEAGDVRQVAVKIVRVAGTTDPAEYVRNANTEVHELRLHPTLDEGCDGLLLQASCDSAEDCGGAACLGAADGVRGRCAAVEAALPEGRFDLCAWPDWSRIQRYDVCAPDGARSPAHEVPGWQWYVTDGELDPANAVGNATGERITLTRPAGPFTIWIVLHDGRGGEGWMRYDVE